MPDHRPRWCPVLLAAIVAVGLTVASGCTAESSPDSRAVGIAFDTLARISFAGLPTPEPNAPVAVSPRSGRYAIAPRADDGQIMIFEPTGEPFRTIGSFGEGPGEFKRVTSLLFGPDDSLYVFDSTNGRMSVFGPDLHFDRDAGMRVHFFSVAWAAPGVLAVQGRFRDLEAPGFRARLYRDGRMIPFAYESGIQYMNQVESNYRPMSPAVDSGVWISEFRSIGARRFLADGSVAEEVDLETEFMQVVPENAAAWEGLIDTRAGVLGISQDNSGALWFLIGLPARRLPEPPATRHTERPATTITPDDLADHVLGVTDRARTAWLARRSFDYLDGNLLPDGRAYLWSEDLLGEKSLTVVRLLIDDSPKPKE